MENYNIIKDNINKNYYLSYDNLVMLCLVIYYFTNRIPEIVQDINLIK